MLLERKTFAAAKVAIVDILLEEVSCSHLRHEVIEMTHWHLLLISPPVYRMSDEIQ
jgi:hypothetical protein